MSETDRFSKLQVFFHWGTLLLLVLVYVLADGIEDAWDAWNKTGDATLGMGGSIHVYGGLAVLALTALRLLTRWIVGVPAPVGGTSRLMEKRSDWTHAALYLLLIIVPASGALAWYGSIEISADAHELSTNVGLALIGLHAVAALYHQYVLKDGLLNRMR